MKFGESLPPVASAPPRILIVDADASRRGLLETTFQAEGYDVSVLPDADRVIDVVRLAPPDLVVIDAFLPGVSGFDLCGDLRMVDEARLTSILVVAATVDEAMSERALACGADDVCVAPDRLRELKARVRVQLRNRRDRWLLQWARQQRASFRQAARIDPLTQIANRRSGDEALAEALSGPTIVLLVDIDHFKQVNDTHGHLAGDAVLREVAQSLARVARQGDTVARYGGEEFMVVIRGARPDHAGQIGERFRRAVSEQILDPALGVRRVSISVGVACWDGSGKRPTSDALVDCADHALYQAKRGGRNQVVTASVTDVRAASSPAEKIPSVTPEQLQQLVRVA